MRDLSFERDTHVVLVFKRMTLLIKKLFVLFIYMNLCTCLYKKKMFFFDMAELQCCNHLVLIIFFAPLHCFKKKDYKFYTIRVKNDYETRI